MSQKQFFDSKTALVTGASSGIGMEFARQLAARNSNLILTARSEDKLRALADQLRSPSVKAVVLPMDLSEPDSPIALRDRIAAENISVDILVNNAGFGALGEFSALSIERQLRMIVLNVTSLTHLTHLYLPQMLERKSGAVLNVASLAGFQPGPNMAVYYATKAYVLSFTEAIAEEVAGSGVHVSCLAPGATETGFGEESGMDNSRLFELGTMSAKEVARSGLNGLARNETLVVPGVKNKVSAFAVRLLPRSTVRRLVNSLQQT